MSFEEYCDAVETELEEQLGDDYDFYVDLDDVLSERKINEAIEHEIDPCDYANLALARYAIF